MSMHCWCAWCPQRPGEGVVSPETGVTLVCAPPYGCWELNQGAPKKLVLLTAEPSLQPRELCLLWSWNTLDLKKAVCLLLDKAFTFSSGTLYSSSTWVSWAIDEYSSVSVICGLHSLHCLLNCYSHNAQLLGALVQTLDSILQHIEQIFEETESDLVTLASLI